MPRLRNFKVVHASPRLAGPQAGLGLGLGLALGLALLVACPARYPAPIIPLAQAQAEGAEVEEMQLAKLAQRIGPKWVPAPLVEITPKLGEDLRVLTPRVRVVPRGEVGTTKGSALAQAQDGAAYEPEPLDTVFAELVAVDASGEHTWLSEAYSLDTDNCDPQVELNALEGVTVPGHYMFQLTCGGGGDTIFVDSYTMLVRVELEQKRARVLWEGEGTSTNERDTCLSYDVVSFFATADGKQVLAARDREVVRTDDPEQEPQVVCDTRDFVQLAAAEIDLEAEVGQGVTEFEVPEPDEYADEADESDQDESEQDESEQDESDQDEEEADEGEAEADEGEAEADEVEVDEAAPDEGQLN